MNPIDITHPRQNRSAETTLLLVLGAETVLFGTLVMSYLFLRTNGPASGFPQIQTLDRILAGVNTLILLASAGFSWGAARAVARGSIDRLKLNLFITLILGTIFVFGQVFEFNHSGMKITGTVFSGATFALISFHALHVLAGMTLLALNFFRARLGDFSTRRHVAITVGSWFWYYVTAVWFVLFAVLYLV